jgi:hypothetical protein
LIVKELVFGTALLRLRIVLFVSSRGMRLCRSSLNPSTPLFLQRKRRYQTTWLNYLISLSFSCAAEAGREL